LDPAFTFLGWAFNPGQIVATTGRITKRDLNGLLDWETRQVTHPDIFMMGDQGLTNYVLQRKLQNKEVTLHREPFMVWPGRLANVEHISVADLIPAGKHEELIHWAGLRWGRRLGQMPRSDILLHFEELYYSRIPRGALIRGWRQFSPVPHAAVLKHPLRALSRLRGTIRQVLPNGSRGT
jgi:hypothetical protein